MFRNSIRTFAALLVLSLASPNARAELLVTEYSSGGPGTGGTMQRFDPITGAQLNPPMQPAGTFVQASGVALGSDGFIYVSNFGTNSIVKFDPANPSTPTTVVNLGANYGPTTIRFDSTGQNLYICRLVDQLQGPNVNNGTIDRFHLGTQVLTTVATGLNQPNGLMFVSSTEVIVSELNGYFAGQLTKVNITNGNKTTFVANSGVDPNGVVGPSNMTMGPDGNYYVADVFAQVIRRYTPAGAPVGSGIFASGVGLNSPADVLFTNGYMFVANLGADFTAANGFVSRFNGTTGAFDMQFSPNLFAASTLIMSPVPEPSSLLLVGAVGVWGVRRIRRARTKRVENATAGGATI